MIKKFFMKKQTEEDTYDLADQIKTQLDILKSDFVLGKLTEGEYRELCKTINDGALKSARERISNIEELMK